MTLPARRRKPESRPVPHTTAGGPPAHTASGGSGGADGVGDDMFEPVPRIITVDGEKADDDQDGKDVLWCRCAGSHRHTPVTAADSGRAFRHTR